MEPLASNGGWDWTLVSLSPGGRGSVFDSCSDRKCKAHIDVWEHAAPHRDLEDAAWAFIGCTYPQSAITSRGLHRFCLGRM